jgi:hypothetical protein
MITLPYTYALRNTLEIAHELSNLHINDQYKLATFDIKDLNVKLPIQDIIKATKFWLYKFNIPREMIQQAVLLIDTVLSQNYFQHNNQYYKPDTGIAMGSPLSSIMTETYLQYFEELLIKHWLESREIIFYRRYVDDIFIIFDQNKTNIDMINSLLNTTIPHLEFTHTMEENSTITYLDLNIQRNTRNLLLSIHRKPTQTDITIRHTSNHPTQHKMAAYKAYIYRMLTLPITKQAQHKEWDTICSIALNNGYPLDLIHRTRNRIARKLTMQQHETQLQHKSWSTFTYSSPPNTQDYKFIQTYKHRHSVQTY